MSQVSLSHLMCRLEALLCLSHAAHGHGGVQEHHAFYDERRAAFQLRALG